MNATLSGLLLLHKWYSIVLVTEKLFSDKIWVWFGTSKVESEKAKIIMEDKQEAKHTQMTGQL